jgi:Fe-S cluster assembly iron-binding protein IscA
MALDVPSTRDRVFEQDGITVVIAKLDLPRIPDVRIEVLGDLLVARAVLG